MVVVRLQQARHAADVVPLVEPHCTIRPIQHSSIEQPRAACGTDERANGVGDSPCENGAPTCARLLQVLERGRRLLREMERGGNGSVQHPFEQIASPTDRPSGARASQNLCWSCLTRPESRPSPTTIQRLLEGAIRQTVLPRLRARHGCSIAPLPATAARLADRLLAPSLGIGRTIDAIEAIARPYGWSAASCAPLFEQCARNLGDRFARDACDDLQLTTALLTLQAALDSMVESWPHLPEPAPAALVVTAPGEPHRLAAQLAERALQHAGWRTASATPGDEAALAERVAAEHFDILHIALSPAFRRDHWQARLARLIATARAASRNPALMISVGGRLFSEASAAWSTVGADTGSTSSSTLARTIASPAAPASPASAVSPVPRRAKAG